MSKAYTTTQIAALKKGVLKEITTVETTIAHTELLVVPIAPDCSLGRLTRMDALAMKATNEEALRMAKINLANLQRALPMMDTPTYGICTKCNAKIPLERLRVAPAVPICMGCITKMRG